MRPGQCKSRSARHSRSLLRNNQNACWGSFTHTQAHEKVQRNVLFRHMTSDRTTHCTGWLQNIEFPPLIVSINKWLLHSLPPLLLYYMPIIMQCTCHMTKAYDKRGWGEAHTGTATTTSSCICTYTPPCALSTTYYILCRSSQQLAFQLPCRLSRSLALSLALWC
jgi:hypothetical protein